MESMFLQVPAPASNASTASSDGIPPYRIGDFIGRRVVRDTKEDTDVSWGDVLMAGIEEPAEEEEMTRV